MKQCFPSCSTGSADGDWRDQAACRNADPDLFFPISTMGPGLRRINDAKRVCAGCPVREPCLNWAVESGEDSGVWGGTTGEERRALRYLRSAR
ncbi:MAG TPA: WhiB family transcriptional regulator [Streptosporangiaceae bacterium]|nr:WhiB family transcriptional regulator [Streptosporangiaceae bacterium]